MGLAHREPHVHENKRICLLLISIADNLVHVVVLTAIGVNQSGDCHAVVQSTVSILLESADCQALVDDQRTEATAKVELPLLL